MFMDSEGEPALDVAHIRFLLSSRVDGLILSLASETDPATLEQLGKLEASDRPSRSRCPGRVRRERGPVGSRRAGCARPSTICSTSATAGSRSSPAASTSGPATPG